MLQLHVNGQDHQVAMEVDTPLLRVLRDGLLRASTSYACGFAVCAPTTSPAPSTVASPSTRAQLEGGIVYGLSASLKGAITVTGGRIQQSNFDDFPLLRLNECPQIDVHNIESEQTPGGVGEPGVPPTAPAVANAVFALTGQPVRSLPIRLNS